jgi:hypothetical protein
VNVACARLNEAFFLFLFDQEELQIEKVSVCFVYKTVGGFMNLKIITVNEFLIDLKLNKVFPIMSRVKLIYFARSKRIRKSS